MLYHLLYPLKDYFIGFNVFRYITFRASYALLTAMAVSLALGPVLIAFHRRYSLGESIREDGPKTHLAKEGTPTMGGMLILLALFVSIILWADLTNKYVWLLLYTAVGFGLIGFADDYRKVILKEKKGLGVREKLAAQCVVALGVACFLYFDPHGHPFTAHLTIPFFKRVAPNLGLFYIPFVVLVIVGVSNAVNITDGLDGLAIGPVIIATVAYVVIAYVTGHSGFAKYLNIIHIQGAGEVAVFGAAMIGAGLGFLWYNSYPAEIFMGDVGALALGGLLGTAAVITKHELLLLVVGGLFVIEALSVILQVAYFRWSGGKRIFKMAPLHHHFEVKGWEEPKVIVRFWIIAIILALLSLSTLKLR
ncbi:MAG: phospho-N-acetylmuramoyl-pentapeptide-transferase [bacterium]